MSDGSGRLEVWMMKADGSAPAQLTRTGVTGHFLRWTPDGRSVLYRCPCGGTPRTLSAPLSGEEPSPVGDVAGGAHMSLSPDGSRVMDVVAHKGAVGLDARSGGKPEKVFEFPTPILASTTRSGRRTAASSCSIASGRKGVTSG
jgi:hypothetical protein